MAGTMNGSQRDPFSALYEDPSPELELKIGTWAGLGEKGLAEASKDLVEGLEHQGGGLDQCPPRPKYQARRVLAQRMNGLGP